MANRPPPPLEPTAPLSLARAHSVAAGRGLNAATGISAGERHRWIDVLTVISCIGVVTLHTNGIFWQHPAGRLWITASIIESLFYFTVPVFLMISGATLLDWRKRYTFVEFAKRRFNRAVVPYLFWSVAFYLVVFHAELAEEGAGALRNLPYCIFNHGVIGIYWFFPVLFACYTAIAVLGYVENKRTVFKHLAAAAFVCHSVVPFLRSAFGLRINTAFMLPVCTGYAVLPVIGYVLAKCDIPKAVRLAAYALGIAGFAAHLFMTIELSPPGAPISRLYKGFSNWPAVLYASAIFVWARYTDWSFLCRNRAAAWCIGKVRSASLGIYLLHGGLVYCAIPFFAKRFAVPGLERSIWYRLLGPIVIVAICTAVTEVFRRIPVLRRAMG